MTKIFLSCTISVGLAPLANKYINIYTRNLKFEQLVTELASLAINIYTRNLKFEQLVTELASLANI